MIGVKFRLLQQRQEKEDGISPKIEITTFCPGGGGKNIEQIKKVPPKGSVYLGLSMSNEGKTVKTGTPQE